MIELLVVELALFVTLRTDARSEPAVVDMDARLLLGGGGGGRLPLDVDADGGPDEDMDEEKDAEADLGGGGGGADLVFPAIIGAALRGR